MLRSFLFCLLILVKAEFSFSAKVDTLHIKSKSMHKSIPNLVIKPDNYIYTNKRFPVVYLLHGAGDNYLGWLKVAPDLTKYADSFNVIIVCPDGGNTSWYFDSPIDSKMKYETYTTSELVKTIDIKYRTIANKTGRALSGLSMGGHGALYLSFRHTDIYGAAGSTSGGVDIRPFPNGWDLPKRLGPYKLTPGVWDKHTVINMVDKVVGKNLQIIFDCGYDDFFYEGNKKLHLKLVEKKIKHVYKEKPGNHSVAYWRESIFHHFVFFNEYFSKSNQ